MAPAGAENYAGQSIRMERLLYLAVPGKRAVCLLLLHMQW